MVMDQYLKIVKEMVQQVERLRWMNGGHVVEGEDMADLVGME